MCRLKRLRPAVIASLLVWAGNSVLAATDDRITAFILSSGGVAEVHRSVSVRGASPIELSVPQGQVDDLLKSLVVHDPQGAVRHVVLDGESPMQELFERLPFGVQDLASPARLAASILGTPVRATSGGRTVEGSVLGVREPASARDSTEQIAAQLSVLTREGQVQVLRLGADTVLDILDEPLRQRLQAAVLASGQHDLGTEKRLKIVLDGQGERDVNLTYVTAAPVWKSAYRLLAREGGQARLQAWAVFENATGQDWDGVRITLVSGAPVVLSQPLYARYWNARTELPVAVGAARPPTPDALAERAVAAYAPPPAPMALSAAPMSKSQQRIRMADAQREAAARTAAGMDEPALLAASAQEGQVSVSYVLPAPVTAAAGQTVSVPYIDATLTAEPLAVFQPQRGGVHPVAAVLLKNETPGSLPPGILTVYDEATGHIGDAQMVAMPAGESRMVYFADDRKIEVRTEEHPQARVSAVSLSQGLLTLRREVRRETHYSIKGASDASRVVVIEHPRRDGWTFQSDALSGETAKHHRLRVSVPAGGQALVKALAVRSERESMALLDTGADDILRWSGQVADEKTRAALATLAQLRRSLSAAQQQEEALAGSLERAMANQVRIRDNLSAVPADSELGQRYLKALAQQESVIDTLLAQEGEARDETARRRRALQEQVLNGGV